MNHSSYVSKIWYRDRSKTHLQIKYIIFFVSHQLQTLQHCENLIWYQTNLAYTESVLK
jgi:hypothetical protein